MRIGPLEIKRRVWVGLVFAFAVTVGWWRWSQWQVRAITAVAVPRQPAIVLTGVGPSGADQAMREQAALFDPTPLFFPTEWNYGQGSLPDSLQRQPGQVFGSYAPKWSFPEQDLKLSSAEAGEGPVRLADVLTQGNEAPFAGMGHLEAPHEPLPERSGFVEVRSLKSDKPLIQQALVGLSIPRPDYSPVEFIVAVSAAGVIGEPVLASGSGWDEVDAFFRSYLVKTFRVGERLNPGQYRVFIGP